MPYLSVSEEVSHSWEAPKHQWNRSSGFNLGNFTAHCAMLG